LTFSTRHDNDSCDLTIQAVATCWLIDVAQKLRKRYSRISQILGCGGLLFGLMATRWSVFIVATQLLLSVC